ncbi:MAG: AAA domain-containing protein [Streptosporangiaceae bacterium]|jgi:predicted O-methyltransferase YrrM
MSWRDEIDIVLREWIAALGGGEGGQRWRRVGTARPTREAGTLARFRTVKAVLNGPYDVVLIDEVGAATLPEVLLAVAKASECAVLIGDFMQLGPILPRTLQDSDRADIRRWLVTDPFRHCGITTLTEAMSHSACLVLDTQHRFG